MLVLSRQRDETIVIGDEIEITIVDIRGEKVRLGINAPPHVPVHRKEVYEAIKRETQGGDGHVKSLAMKKHPPGEAPPKPPEPPKAPEPPKPPGPEAPEG